MNERRLMNEDGYGMMVICYRKALEMKMRMMDFCSPELSRERVSSTSS